MIAARKVAAFNFVVRRWLSWLLRRRFHGVYIFGTEHLRALNPGAAVVGCVNHTNWWDGFVLYVLSWRLLPHDIYLAMEEKNLRRYRFFAWMGVFGVDLSERAAALPGMRYALRLLLPGRLVWMFVQGRLLPPGTPVEVKPGALFLARRAGAALLPIILRYEWLNESRPSIFVLVGPPMAASTAANELAAVLNDLRGQLDPRLHPINLNGAESLFPPRLSVNKRWDYLRHRLWRRREVFDPQNR